MIACRQFLNRSVQRSAELDNSCVQTDVNGTCLEGVRKSGSRLIRRHVSMRCVPLERGRQTQSQFCRVCVFSPWRSIFLGEVFLFAILHAHFWCLSHRRAVRTPPSVQVTLQDGNIPRSRRLLIARPGWWDRLSSHTFTRLTQRRRDSSGTR